MLFRSVLPPSKVSASGAFRSGSLPGSTADLLPRTPPHCSPASLPPPPALSAVFISSMGSPPDLCPGPACSGLDLLPPGYAPLTLPGAFPPAGVSTPDIMPTPAAALPVGILPAPASIFTLATAPPPACPAVPSASRPSPVSPSLWPAILQGDYVDLADLLLLSQVFAPRTIFGSCGPVLLRHPEPDLLPPLPSPPPLLPWVPGLPEKG